MRVKCVAHSHVAHLCNIEKAQKAASLLLSVLVARQRCSWQGLVLQLHSLLMVKQRAHAMLTNDRLGLLH